MDSLITAAARALAAGDPLGALKRVATGVLVRDSHGDKGNLLPADVDPRVRALVEQVRALLGRIGAVAVKEEIGGGAALGMSPKRAQEEIRRGVEQAIRDRARARVYKLAGPYTMVLTVKQEPPSAAGDARDASGAP